MGSALPVVLLVDFVGLKTVTASLFAPRQKCTKYPRVLKGREFNGKQGRDWESHPVDSFVRRIPLMSRGQFVYTRSSCPDLN